MNYLKRTLPYIYMIWNSELQPSVTIINSHLLFTKVNFDSHLVRHLVTGTLSCYHISQAQM